MSDIGKAREALLARVLQGDGTASHEMRRAAFDNIGLSKQVQTLVEKVVKRANTVTDEDIAAVRASGLSEDQILEIIVCAAIGQAARQYETALAALDAVVAKV